MTPSHLTVFLDHGDLGALGTWADRVPRELLTVDRFEMEDQTGDRAPVLQLTVAGGVLVVLPANGFHGAFDYEIGLLSTDPGEWTRWLADLGARGLDVEEGPYGDGDRYALVGSPALHGPFFSLFSPAATRAPGPEWSLAASLGASERDFYFGTEPVFPPGALGPWDFTVRPDGRFLLSRVSWGRGTPVAPLGLTPGLAVGVGPGWFELRRVTGGGRSGTGGRGS